MEPQLRLCCVANTPAPPASRYLLLPPHPQASPLVQSPSRAQPIVVPMSLVWARLYNSSRSFGCFISHCCLLHHVAYMIIMCTSTPASGPVMYFRDCTPVICTHQGPEPCGVSILQLVEAKLRRAYQEGQAARLAGQDPLAAELAASTHRLRTATPAPALPIALEDGDHPPTDPLPAPQTPSQPAENLAQPVSDVSHPGLSREEELSIAQADANMAALLKEEAG